MEGNNIILETNITKLSSDSSQITGNLSYLNVFHTKRESWDMCMTILSKHSTDKEKFSKNKLEVLLYCSSILKSHAYNGFKNHLEVSNTDFYKEMSSICSDVTNIFVEYCKTSPKIADQLSSVIACTVIYSFDISAEPSKSLFLITLSKLKNGTLSQYLYLSTVAKELLENNISVNLSQRGSFIRFCTGISPMIFFKLLVLGRLGELSLDHVRLDTVTNWIKIQIYLLNFFNSSVTEHRNFETSEMIFDDVFYPKQKMTDIELVHSSFVSLNRVNVVDTIMNFIKFGIGSEDEHIMESSSELCVNLIKFCKIDISYVLMMTSYKYHNYPSTENSVSRWRSACAYSLSIISPLIIRIITDIVLGLSKISDYLTDCAIHDKKMRFLRGHTSKWLLNVYSTAASEHLPLVAYFRLLKYHQIESICNFVNFYLFSENLQFRKDALEFWSNFLGHLCPLRSDLTYTNSTFIEFSRILLSKIIRPFCDIFIEDLYDSCLMSKSYKFELITKYREHVADAINFTTLLTGLNNVMKLIKEDLFYLLENFDLEVLDRCLFITSVIADKFPGPKSSVKFLIKIALEKIDFKKISQSKISYSNFYKNTLFRVIIWTSSVITKDKELFSKTVKMLLDEIKITKSTNLQLDSHVFLDQCLIALCYSLEPDDPIRKKFMDHLSSSIINYLSPLSERLDIIQGFMYLLHEASLPEYKRIKFEVLKALFSQIFHLKKFKNIPEFQIFIFTTMCSVDFKNTEELKVDVVKNIFEFIQKFKNSEELWSVVSDLVKYVSFIDEYDESDECNLGVNRDKTVHIDPEILDISTQNDSGSIPSVPGGVGGDNNSGQVTVDSVVNTFNNKDKKEDQYSNNSINLLPENCSKVSFDNGNTITLINLEDSAMSQGTTAIANKPTEVTSDALEIHKIVNDKHDTVPNNKFGQVEKNKLNFILWLLETTKPSFIQLNLIKNLMKNRILSQNPYISSIIITNTKILCKRHMRSVGTDTSVDDNHLLMLMDSLKLIMTRWDLYVRILSWKSWGNFINLISNSITTSTYNLNEHFFSILSLFSGWADIPKQMINSDIVANNNFKFIKKRTRNLLLRKRNENSNSTILNNIIDAVFRLTLDKNKRMESWLTSASQMLFVLIKCKKLFEITKIKIKKIMSERCHDLSKTHIRFYHKKLIQSRRSTEIKFILRIISEYHNSKFNFY